VTRDRVGHPHAGTFHRREGTAAPRRVTGRHLPSTAPGPAHRASLRPSNDSGRAAGQHPPRQPHRPAPTVPAPTVERRLHRRQSYTPRSAPKASPAATRPSAATQSPSAPPSAPHSRPKPATSPGGSAAPRTRLPAISQPAGPPAIRPTSTASGPPYSSNAAGTSSRMPSGHGRHGVTRGLPCAPPLWAPITANIPSRHLAAYRTGTANRSTPNPTNAPGPTGF
jgi:hypothetical protein